MFKTSTSWKVEGGDRRQQHKVYYFWEISKTHDAKYTESKFVKYWWRFEEGLFELWPETSQCLQ